MLIHVRATQQHERGRQATKLQNIDHALLQYTNVIHWPLYGLQYRPSLVSLSFYRARCTIDHRQGAKRGLVIVYM